MVTFGRVLQGMGAISGAVLALASDLTREEQRPKVMAVIGMTIGLSFAVAMILGPLIAAQAGLSGIFWFTAGAGGLWRVDCQSCWCRKPSVKPVALKLWPNRVLLPIYSAIRN